MAQRKRVCIVGAGISGLGAAWAMNRHPERFDFEVWERTERIGGNAITAEMPQADGSVVPFDIAVTADIPTAYHHYLHLLEQYGIQSLPTRFSYSVRYGDGVYAHDFDSPLKRQLQPEIDKFQRLLAHLRQFTALSSSTSRAKAALNPYNYVPMGTLLDAWGISHDFRYKVLKPLFVNFVLASALFDMPAALFARYLDFFDVEKATSMVTWDQGTQNLYRRMTADFKGRIHRNRGVASIVRDGKGVLVRDVHGNADRFDEVILACNANQGLMMLAEPSAPERFIMGAVRYESELHNHAIVHWDDSILPKDETDPVGTRSNYIEQYGSRPDNYEITYIMHNQQPWAKRSDKPCLVTYNPVKPIDPAKVIGRYWYQHVVHDVRHFTVTMNLFQFIQGRAHTWHCGAHTAINSQEHGFISGLVIAHQLGADYPFPNDAGARDWFQFWGRSMLGPRFSARRPQPAEPASATRRWAAAA